MSVLTSQNTAEWYTPSGVIELARHTLGGTIDLDPASCAFAQRWIKANRYFEIAINGLTQNWRASTVWLNPPFDSTSLWVSKMRSEFLAGNFNAGLLIVNSALGYNWYEDLWRQYPICCLRQRLCFVNAQGQTNGQAKKGQTIVYMANHDWGTFIEDWRHYGRIILP